MIFYKELIVVWLFLLSNILIQASPISLQLAYQTKKQQLSQQSHHNDGFMNEQSLFDKLAPEADLSIFLELLMRNDLLFNYLNATTSEKTLTMTGQPLTVFCPTNQAFLNYWKTQPKKTWNGLLERHIVPQTRLDPISLKHAYTLKTLLPGATIHVKQSSTSWPWLSQQHHPMILLDGGTLVDTYHPIQSPLSIAYKIDHVLPYFYIQ